MKRILIVEDDEDIVKIIRTTLERDGFEVAATYDGASGMAEVRRSRPDLLILDLVLPKLQGLEVCKAIRADRGLRQLPILILTARRDEADRIVGLELGADDYVTKPFSARELLARVRALLRRAEPPEEVDRPVEVGGLRLDPASRRAVLEGRPLTLTKQEFDLIHFLASRPGRIFSRQQLLDEVWGESHFVTPRNVDAYIRRLRRKIGSDPVSSGYLKTVRGVGYMFDAGGVEPATQREVI
jgi:two-component system alkaline phosphatase synthesis response regulator PhoP